MSQVIDTALQPGFKFRTKNFITDVSHLSNLIKLKSLNLVANMIENISCFHHLVTLISLPNLTSLDLAVNPIEEKKPLDILKKMNVDYGTYENDEQSDCNFDHTDSDSE
ncbi:hypothetical protein BC833DRAFT_662225 [Globomyces pollinis-pini]|nr:hypothetical protein BC833DRAFT_662225 [Globomyces pollinis-pini]